MAAMVLKDKYFRHFTILDSNLGHRPSVMWRSLWGSLELLKEGLVWRVGNGRQINIWGDKWIPKLSTMRVQTPRTLLEADAKVSEFIKEGSKTWKEEMIKGILNEEEVALVCSLPMSTSGLPDKLIGLTHRMDNLIKIVKDYYCPVCKIHKETAENASPVQKWVSNEREMQELWADWCEKLSINDLELMVMVLKRIWLRRNNFVFENKFEKPDVLFKLAADSLFQFKQVQQQSHKNQDAGIRRRRSCRWKAPAKDQVKVNWDAALKIKEGRMGIGVVIRDENGDVMVSLCSQKRNVRDPLVAELQALRQAMKLCADLNITEVIFEGDALKVVRAVNNLESSWEWHGQVVEDIKKVLRNRTSWKVIHAYRESNCVAHFLAKFSFTVNEDRIWIEEGPEGMQVYVLKDKNVVTEVE
ncbi:uncharacterized protein LOC122306301 [Carya illinoinensis]|uniref:uncharacterized protein LOC122306301 n=1 Tax=Carya illinoinensis TaxID=32201 RepID=UPI001C71FBC2|nr:uncharacterized protein LOC122306301 [Carya illinoinensis]